MATSPGQEEAHFYACRLNEFRWTLTVSSKKAAWIQGALENLHATSQMLRGLPEKPSTAAADSEHDLHSYHISNGGAEGMDVDDRWSSHSDMNSAMTIA